MDRLTSCHGIVRAMHTRRAVKMMIIRPTLYCRDARRGSVFGARFFVTLFNGYCCRYENFGMDA